jgi:hypothetical protein
MIRRTCFLATLLIAGLAIAPAAPAKDWHYHGHPGPGRYYGPEHHGGDAAAAAIVGGLIGLGIGAAITSGGAYPPPAYYGPPPGYYGPPPPGVYYGYGY